MVIDQLPEITVTTSRQSSINPLPPRSEGRRPRGIVKVNGHALPGWIEWEFDNNSNYQADTFRVTFAAGALPKDRNAAWLTEQGDITVEILAGFPQNPDAPSEGELTSFIIGRCDEMLYDPVQNTIELSGRDFTSQFIDSKSAENFKNRSVANIVIAVASRHQMKVDFGFNLFPGVQGTLFAIKRPKSVLDLVVGAFSGIDVDLITDKQTEWDLLTFLAQLTKCSVFVTGQTLNFIPAQDPTTSNPYVIQWTPPTDTNGSPQANLIDIRFSRNLTLTKDVTVIVTSWDRNNGVSFKTTAKATHNKNSVTRNASLPYGQPQVYSYRIPGLSRQQAIEKAQALLAEISKHEMRFDAQIPGDNILTARTVVSVRGTGTPFDQTYYPNSVIRSMSVTEGYRMRLDAKNHSPEPTLTIEGAPGPAPDPDLTPIVVTAKRM